MLPGGNSRDDVIIVVANISDLHITSGCGLSGSADAASGPDSRPLPRYDYREIFAAPLLGMSRLVELIKHSRFADVTSTHIWGLWQEGIRSSGALGGTGENLTASPLTPTP